MTVRFVTSPRIIPARAGFTAPLRSRRRGRGDHPRSRGVYLLRKRSRFPKRGSSPLARGLQPCPTPMALRCRIIPARAGFTVPVWMAWDVDMDHPRSRGVYTHRELPYGHGGGSSPLARGLLSEEIKEVKDARIIPARAGFTQGGPAFRRRNQDHPRSRGVYVRLVTVLTRNRGSSPLARGLHGGDADCSSLIRIIPARAGFTFNYLRVSRFHQDHPRSRGVYVHRNNDDGQH